MIILLYLSLYNESFMKTGVVLVSFPTACLTFSRVSGKNRHWKMFAQWINEWIMVTQQCLGFRQDDTRLQDWRDRSASLTISVEKPLWRGMKQRKEEHQDVCACCHNLLFVILWTITRQAPLSMGFSRQESWSGLPCPSLGNLPYLGIEPGFPALQEDSLPLSHQGNPTSRHKLSQKDYGLVSERRKDFDDGACHHSDFTLTAASWGWTWVRELKLCSSENERQYKWNICCINACYGTITVTTASPGRDEDSRR